MIALAGVTGCAARRAPSALTFMDYHTDEPAHSVLTRLLNECGQQIGMRVEHRSVVNDQLVPKALRMASSRSLPDVLMLDNPDLPQFASTTALNPLPELGVTSEGMYPGVAEAGRHRGKLYGVAPTVNTLGLYYNKDILERAGVEPPRTWAELATAAAELTGEQHHGIAFSAFAGLEGAYQFLAFFWPAGADERDLDSPEAVRALRFWVDLVRSGSASRSVLSWGQSDVNDQFQAGKAAMMINGSWQAASLREAEDLRWGVVPVPVPHPGARPVAPLGGEVMTVPKTTPERQRKAARLVECMNSEPVQLELAAATDRVPSRPSAARELRPLHPDLRVFYDAIPSARSRTALLGTRWPATAQAMWTAFQSAIAGRASPQEALRAAERRLEANP